MQEAPAAGIDVQQASLTSSDVASFLLAGKHVVIALIDKSILDAAVRHSRLRAAGKIPASTGCLPPTQRRYTGIGSFCMLSCWYSYDSIISAILQPTLTFSRNL